MYICPAGERLAYRFTNEEKGLTLRRYWTTACQGCVIKGRCTTGKERRITRWEHEHLLEAVQRRLPTAGWRQTNSSFFQIWPGSNLKKTKMLPDFLASPPDVIRGLRCPLSSPKQT